MLGCHPQMYGLPEINLFAGETMAEMQELYRQRAHRDQGFLRVLAQLAFSEQTEETVEAARQWLLDNAELSTAELFRTMQSWLPDRILIDKSPLHVFMPESMIRMQTHFPDASYLHLTRHPCDMIKSLPQLQQTCASASWSGPGCPARPLDRALTRKAWKILAEPNLLILEFLESAPVEHTCDCAARTSCPSRASMCARSPNGSACERTTRQRRRCCTRRIAVRLLWAGGREARQ
jgi:hypothetical protein